MGKSFLCNFFFLFNLIALVENSKLFHLCDYLPCLTPCTVTNNISLPFFSQDCLPVAWDTNEDLIEQEERYEQILSDHYSIPQQPRAAESSPGDNRTPFIPSPSEDRKINPDQGKSDEEEENYNERAPFIPLSIDDSQLDDNDLLVEIPFIDSPLSLIHI